jgi:hypothetical protein
LWLQIDGGMTAEILAHDHGSYFILSISGARPRSATAQRFWASPELPQMLDWTPAPGDRLAGLVSAASLADCTAALRQAVRHGSAVCRFLRRCADGHERPFQASLLRLTSRPRPVILGVVGGIAAPA